MSHKKKRNIIIGTLCGVLLLMVVGYAAFNSVLNIKGTSNINSNWDVKITGITLDSSKGATDNEGSPKFDNLSATFNTNFTTPGDYATYKIEITNNGSMDAKLTKITMPENTNNDIIFYLNKDQNNTDIANTLKQNDTLFKKGETGNVGYVYVTVLYRDYENQQTAENKSASMTIEFDFEQADVSGTVTPTPQPQTVYAYHTDAKRIGTSKLTEADYAIDYTHISGYNETTRPWFLKYDIDEEGVIQNAYACMKYSFIEEPICMQGGSADYYASNKAILEGLQTTFTSNSGNCSLGVSDSRCIVGAFDVNANPYGIVGARDDSSDAYCAVFGDGIARCLE